MKLKKDTVYKVNNLKTWEILTDTMVKRGFLNDYERLRFNCLYKDRGSEVALYIDNNSEVCYGYLSFFKENPKAYTNMVLFMPKKRGFKIKYV